MLIFTISPTPCKTKSAVLITGQPFSAPHGSDSLSFCGVVLEEFLDEVDVGHDHAPAAVTAEFKLVHGISEGLLVYDPRLETMRLPVRNVVVNKLEVALPDVANDLGKS